MGVKTVLNQGITISNQNLIAKEVETYVETKVLKRMNVIPTLVDVAIQDLLIGLNGTEITSLIKKRIIEIERAVIGLRKRVNNMITCLNENDLESIIYLIDHKIEHTVISILSVVQMITINSYSHAEVFKFLSIISSKTEELKQESKVIINQVKNLSH